MTRTLLAALVFLAWLPMPHAQAASPSVADVDPPSWWIGHSTNEIQLLVHGSGLAGTTLTSGSDALMILRQRVNDAGTYLIAYARVERGRQPQSVPLRIAGPGGAADTHFELLAKPDPAGRFAGLSADDVIYLVMPDRFDDGDHLNNGPNYDRSSPGAYHGGDLRGLKDRLPYLKQLGVTTVWMTPIYDNTDTGSDYHGYGATDFYRVEEHLGTMADLRALVAEAHRLGMKVMQDQVANHCGPAHPWAADAPTPTWFNGTPAEHLDNPFAIDSLVNPNADPSVRRATLEGWFANKLPDLNQTDPEVARYLIQNSLWWVEQAGFDAIREDTLPYAPRSFWSDWITALHAEHPTVTVLGEVFHGDPRVVSFFQGGADHDGIDSKVESLFDFPLGYPMAGFFSRQGSALAIDRTLDMDVLYPNPGMLVPFIGNHDTPRALSIMNGDQNALRLAQTCLLTMRGIPQLYYGDEIAMPGGEDPDNRRDFPGGFPGDARNCFLATGRTSPQQAIFANVQRMIALRRLHPSLRGRRTVVLGADERTFVYARVGDTETALVALNNWDVDLPIDVPASSLFADGSTLANALAPGPPVRVAAGRITLRLPAHTAVICFSRPAAH